MKRGVSVIIWSKFQLVGDRAGANHASLRVDFGDTRIVDAAVEVLAHAPLVPGHPIKKGDRIVAKVAYEDTQVGDVGVVLDEPLDVLRAEVDVVQERHLGHRDATALQVAAETSKEQTDGAHQQQHRPVDSHLYESWRPSPAQTANRPSMVEILTRLNGAEAVPSGGTGPAPACAAAEERRAKPPAHRWPAQG